MVIVNRNLTPMYNGQRGSSICKYYKIAATPFNVIYDTFVQYQSFPLQKFKHVKSWLNEKLVYSLETVLQKQLVLRQRPWPEQRLRTLGLGQRTMVRILLFPTYDTPKLTREHFLFVISFGEMGQDGRTGCSEHPQAGSSRMSYKQQVAF